VSAQTWRCGDCGTIYPKSAPECTRYLDDYLSLRGGSIESAITRAVEKAIAPLVASAEARLRPRIEFTRGATLMFAIAA
jgi:hypothetical protein